MTTLALILAVGALVLAALANLGADDAERRLNEIERKLGAHKEELP